MGIQVCVCVWVPMWTSVKIRFGVSLRIYMLSWQKHVLMIWLYAIWDLDRAVQWACATPHLLNTLCHSMSFDLQFTIEELRHTYVDKPTHPYPQQARVPASALTRSWKHVHLHVSNILETKTELFVEFVIGLLNYISQIALLFYRGRGGYSASWGNTFADHSSCAWTQWNFRNHSMWQRLSPMGFQLPLP